MVKVLQIILFLLSCQLILAFPVSAQESREAVAERAALQLSQKIDSLKTYINLNNSKNLSHLVNKKNGKKPKYQVEFMFSQGTQLVSLYNKNIHNFSKEMAKYYFFQIVALEELSRSSFYKTKHGLHFVEYSAKEKLDIIRYGKVKVRTKVRQSYLKFHNEFMRAYPAFSAAQMVVSFMDSLSNPVAFEQFLQQFEDPVLSASSFAVFIAASNTLQSVLGQRLSAGAKGQLGMAAGMLASTIYTEIYNDFKTGDAGTCFEKIKVREGANQEYIDHLKQVKQQACDRAAELWLTTDKYMNYMPDVTSLGTAASLNHKAISTGVRISTTIYEKSNFLKKIGNLKSLKAMAPLGGFVSMVGNFVLFMKIHHAIMPHFVDNWNYHNFTGLGLAHSTELKNNLTQDHKRYLKTLDDNNMRVKWFENNLKDLDHYLDVKSLNECLQEAKILVRRTGKPRLVDNPRAIENCHLHFNPGNILQNDYAFHKEKVRFQTVSFKTKQQNWFQLVGNFTQNVDLAQTFYSEMLSLKENNLHLKKGEYPEDLNDNFFYSIISKYLGFQELDVDKKLYDEYKNGVQFNNIAEYYIYQMACGPDFQTKLPEDNLKLSGYLAKYISWFKDSHVDFVETPFGSSYKFIPPKITSTSRDICKSNINTKIGNSMYVLKRLEEVEGVKNDVFNGFWYDKVRRVQDHNYDPKTDEYSNLAKYVYDNINVQDLESLMVKEVVKNTHPSDENDSEIVLEYLWSDQVLAIMDDVWTEHEEGYVRLIKKSLLPVLLNGEEEAPEGFKDRLKYKFWSFVKNKPKFDPLFSSTLERWQHKIEILSESAQVLGLSSPGFESALDNLSYKLTKEVNKHREYIEAWDNSESLYETAGLEKKKGGFHKEFTAVSDAVNDYEHEYYEYSEFAVSHIASGACDQDILDDIQRIERLAYGVRHFPCSQLDLAKKLQHDIEKLWRKESVVYSQINYLIKEINDYYTLIDEITNTIGNFTDLNKEKEL